MPKCHVNGDFGQCDFLDCVADEVCKRGNMTKEVEELKFPLRLFVYGTLKRNFPNDWHLAKCKFIARANAFGILLHLGPYPAFLPETAATTVLGELWEVPSKEALDPIDRLEGHPHHYKRQEINLVGGERAWTYVYQRYYDVAASRMQHSFNMVVSGSWIGPESQATPFKGFYVNREPPRTSGLAVAHVRYTGEFAGLVDCAAGEFLRHNNFSAEGKPHFTYDQTRNVWVPKDVKALPQLPPPSTEVAKQETWTPYVDPSDPGEISAPERSAA